MSIESVLIANRGEIALRVIEACRELDLRSIVLYSEADEAMPYLRLADASICIGPADPAKSYTNVAAIISAAELIEADAIHPGYGFLAESPHFVEICEEHDLTFVGPPREVMELLGNKLAARDAVRAAGVPVLPGEPVPAAPGELAAAAERIGYPLLVKSVFGGGGRGMRWVAGPDALKAAVAAAAPEAKAACGDERLYLERAVPGARHIEVQIVADGRGALVHFGERECSIQRRHQKLIEESPAPKLSPALRERLQAAALAAAGAVGYRNVGTVEFVLDDDGFFFIEMNARIQVEHPISEAVSGVNLVKEQLRIASGEPLGRRQAEVDLRGWAIECRINAEDPARGFFPSTGTVHIDELPGGAGVRIDSCLYDGMLVSSHYDSLLAKVITWGQDREEARIRMMTALQRFRISGIRTTRELAQEIVGHSDFRDGAIATDFLDRMIG